LHLVIELLKLPIEELFSFQGWLSKLPTQHIRVLIQLLQIESSTLLEIKRRIASSSNISLNSSAAAIPTSNHDAAMPIISTSPSSPSMMLDSIGAGPSGSKSRKRRAEDDLQAELDLIGNGEYSMELDEQLMIYPVEGPPPMSPSMQGIIPSTSPVSHPLSPIAIHNNSMASPKGPATPIVSILPSNRPSLTSSLLSELEAPLPPQQARQSAEKCVLILFLCKYIT
jgi:hypothetical protein